MNSNFENFITMSMAVSAKCHSYQSIVDSSLTFKAALGAIDDRLLIIQEWQQVKNESTVGYTIMKRKARTNAVDAAIAITQAMVGYAFDNKLSDLLQNALIRRTTLMNGRDTKCLDKLKYIHSLAEANADGIKDYGIEAAQITALLALIATYETAIPQPRTHLNKLKNATNQIAKTCGEMAEIFTFGLDAGMEQFRLTQPDFYNEYFNARIIIDLKGPSTGVKGSIADHISKIKLKSVKVFVVEADAVRESNRSGNFSFKKLAPGFYTLTFTVAGYEDFTISNVEVKAGLIASLKILLQKAAADNIAA